MVSTLMLDKIDFKAKNVTRNKQRYFILLKRSIQKENITIININIYRHKYTTGTLVYIKPILTK